MCSSLLFLLRSINSLALLAVIEDPPKLSGKLTRALFRRLQQSPCTWGAYTTSRIGSARFPDRYNASFLDPVSVADLEGNLFPLTRVWFLRSASLDDFLFI